ncbi:hypothetical protein Q7P37_001956 [Cladosporium fusiforme]
MFVPPLPPVVQNNGGAINPRMGLELQGSPGPSLLQCSNGRLNEEERVAAAARAGDVTRREDSLISSARQGTWEEDVGMGKLVQTEFRIVHALASEPLHYASWHWHSSSGVRAPASYLPGLSVAKAASRIIIIIPTGDPAFAHRLNAMELRLAALEQQKTSSPSTMTRQPSVASAQEDGAFKRAPMPMFHTSAAHKLYQYWPRLRINLALDGFDPLQYQRSSDEDDHALEQNLAEAAEATVRPHLVTEYVQRLYHQTNLVPQTIIYLLQMTKTYSLQTALEQIPVRKADEDMGYIKLSELPLSILLLLSVAFHYLSPDPSSDFGTTASSWKCFQLALTRLWTVHSQAEDFMLNSKLMVAVQLQIMYGRPYHALGLLRQVGLSLSSGWTRGRLEMGSHSFITKMPSAPTDFLMESDLLSEIDGQPTADTTQLNFDTSGNVNGSQMQFPLYSAAESQMTPLFLDQTLWLRLCMNRILTTIYMINHSYSNPRFVGRPISDFTSELEFWYRSLPIQLQFPRTLAAYGLLTHIIPSYKVNLAIRYYFCHFMLNRPVCYFLLHKEIERCATPPKTPDDSLNDLADLETWVFESSRNCLHNALLIVACLRSHPQLIGWYQAQYLIACYAVVLQMQQQQPTAFGDSEDADYTLDSIEMLLEQVKVQTTQSRWTVDMLRNSHVFFETDTWVDTDNTQYAGIMRI